MDEELRELAEHFERAILKSNGITMVPGENEDKFILIRKFAHGIATRIVRQRRREAKEKRFREALGMRLTVKKGG